MKTLEPIASPGGSQNQVAKNQASGVLLAWMFATGAPLAGGMFVAAGFDGEPWSWVGAALALGLGILGRIAVWKVAHPERLTLSDAYRLAWGCICWMLAS